MFSFFEDAAKIAIALDSEDRRPRIGLSKHVNNADDKTLQKGLPLYSTSDELKGSVEIFTTSALEHVGVSLYLVGQIEFLYDRGNVYEFVNLQRELEPQGSLARGRKKYEFDFGKLEKTYESFDGFNVQLRYFVKVVIKRSYLFDVEKIHDFAVMNTTVAPKVNNSIKMEVGIEDCLHIEFEYNQNSFHLQDVVVGRIYFLLVRIKIKYMELVLIKRESTKGIGPGNAFNESENVGKFELMDGAPVRGESIPIRMFLGNYNLTDRKSVV